MMKKRYKILLTVVVLLGIAYFCLPYYARQALLYWYPSIDDLSMFDKHTSAESRHLLGRGGLPRIITRTS